MTDFARPEQYPKQGWYWFVLPDKLIGWVNDVDEEWKYVISNRPKQKVKWFRPVLGELPKELIKARETYVEAHGVLKKANLAYDNANYFGIDAGTELAEERKVMEEASQVYYSALRALGKIHSDFYPEIKALHAIECPDYPWNSKTLFAV